MASDKDFVDFVVDQLEGAGSITYRKMFGEYGIYCNGTIVALVCDNRVFVKPTEAGRQYIGQVVEAPACPGAKNSFLIEDKFEDGEWFSELISITEKELLKTPKLKKRGKSGKTDKND